MSKLSVLHTGDLHFSTKPEKLEEVKIVTAALIEKAETERPDLIILAGDTVDEMDSPIRADSETYRCMVHTVQALAAIAPVAIVLGTPSHDRHTPELLRDIHGLNPIYVSTRIEMVALTEQNNGPYDPSLVYPDGFYFYPYGSDYHGGELKAVLTFLPSPDKARIVAMSDGTSKQLTTLAAKECLHDALHYLGEINQGVPAGIPRIVIGHGMITGAEYSTGAVSTGEDLEYSLSDLNATNTDYKAFGHVHKFQTFPGNIVYAGSPGRLNFGEKEEKGFVMATFREDTAKYQGGVEIKFVPLPAREFHFAEVPWQDIDHLRAELTKCAAECAGKDTRFRYEIPEEERHQITRAEIESALVNARAFKVECTILPKVRQRAAGISKLVTLVDKIRKWAATNGIEVPERVYTIAATIEGESVEELLDKARANIQPGTPTMILVPTMEQAQQISADRFAPVDVDLDDPFKEAA